MKAAGSDDSTKDDLSIEPEKDSRPEYKAIHAFISSDELREMASQNGIQLHDKKLAKIKISLHQFLSYMTIGTGEKGVYANLTAEDKSSINALKNSILMGEQKASVESLAKRYWEAIKEKFRIKAEVNQTVKRSIDEDDSESVGALINDTNNYEAYIEIIPYFFSQDSANPEKHIYTLQYMKEGVKTKIRGKMGQFRGYCTDPNCRKPILRYTGLYPHRVVGMLGAMSAGKTSMITAMTVEIEKEYASLGVKAITGEEKLDDDDAEYREMDYQLFQHGWAVGKTSAQTKQGSYNVSFLLSDKDSQSEKMILTLADIAGEKCYDPNKNTFDPKAFETFPMIGHCDAYLACACIDQEGYGNADGKKMQMPPSAIISIATGIIQKYYDREDKIPPLCIVMTKADMVADDINVKDKVNNPFKNMRPDRNEYMFASELRDLTSIFNLTEKKSIEQSLQLCFETYEEMKRQTYTAILSAAAMGREAKKYTGDPQTIGYNMEVAPEGYFKPNRVSEIWKWILRVCGVVRVNSDFKFPEVPSFLEYYSVDHSHYYNIDNCEDRISAIGYIGINVSNYDKKLYRVINGFDPEDSDSIIENAVARVIEVFGFRKRNKHKAILATMPQSLADSKNENMNFQSII